MMAPVDVPPMKSNQSQSRVGRSSMSSMSFSSRSRNPMATAPRTPPPSRESIRLGPGPKRCRSRDDRPEISGGDIEIIDVIASGARTGIVGRTESKNPDRAASDCLTPSTLNRGGPPAPAPLLQAEAAKKPLNASAVCSGISSGKK